MTERCTLLNGNLCSHIHRRCPKKNWTLLLVIIAVMSSFFFGTPCTFFGTPRTHLKYKTEIQVD